MWVPVPSDASWQRILDREAVSAPGSWKLERQAEGTVQFEVLKTDRTPETAKVAE